MISLVRTAFAGPTSVVNMPLPRVAKSMSPLFNTGAGACPSELKLMMAVLPTKLPTRITSALAPSGAVAE